MSKPWYYVKDGQRLGPVASETLKEMACSGQLQPTDQVWREGMASWTAARMLKGLFAEAAPTKPPPLPASVAAVPASAVLTSVVAPVLAVPASAAPVLASAIAPTVLKDPPTPPTLKPIPARGPDLIQSHSDAFGMEDGGDLGIGAAVKTTVNEFKSLDYGFLMPFKKIFSRHLLRKKAVRWVCAMILHLRQHGEATYRLHGVIAPRPQPYTIALISCATSNAFLAAEIPPVALMKANAAFTSGMPTPALATKMKINAPRSAMPRCRSALIFAASSNRPIISI